MSSQIENFFIAQLTVDPIASIMDGLKSGKYRDCDIQWLNGKLFTYTDIAAKTFGLKINAPVDQQFKILNDYTKNYYTQKFSTLHDFFKTFLNN